MSLYFGELRKSSIRSEEIAIDSKPLLKLEDLLNNELIDSSDEEGEDFPVHFSNIVNLLLFIKFNVSVITIFLHFYKFNLKKQYF